MTESFLNGWLNPFDQEVSSGDLNFIGACLKRPDSIESDFRLRAVNRFVLLKPDNAVFFLNQSAVKIGRECELTAERLVIEMLFQHGQPITRALWIQPNPVIPYDPPR